jgi:multiple sugar transport system ATP-binding protein
MRELELDRVEKSFGETRVLRSVSLRVAAGESLALLGPSGSGKSTLLRMIAGLEQPDAGLVRIDGADQYDIPPHRRDVALVFQQYALYPHLTAHRNVTAGLVHGMGMKRREADVRADEVLSSVGMAALAERKPGQLSGGQRQRVALARALARRAGIVLLDEPLSGLDAKLRVEVRGEMAMQLRQTGAAVVHVTHDQGDAMAASDRIAVLERGQLRQVGTPEQLYREPADLFTATFIGVPAMTILPLEPGEDLLRSPFGAFVARGESGPRPAWLGIRAERLRLGGEGELAAEALVTGSELVGADYVVHLDIDGHVGALRVDVRPPAPGTRVTVTTEPQHVHVFDEGEQRIGDASQMLAPALTARP